MSRIKEQTGIGYQQANAHGARRAVPAPLPLRPTPSIPCASFPVPSLRPYQREAARAILRSALRGHGRSFSVLVARQGGKNELSAQIELALLLASWRRPVEAIKCAPTFDPQCRISLRRLWQRLSALPLPAGLAAVEEGNAVRLGRARQRFLSAEPGAHVVGHTAHALLEVDEAQDVDPDKFAREFLPMAAAGNATVVFYGTAWDETNLLAAAVARHREQERRDGIRRHFAADWRAVAACNPAYARYVAAERERLGEEHPLFQTQYLLRPLPGSGRLLAPAALALLEGSHARLDARPAAASEPPGTLYVAGLDVGGETLAQTRRDPDRTVLTIARVLPASPGLLLAEPAIEVVAIYAWQGAGHGELAGAIARLARDCWRLRRLAIDATGIGEGLAAALAAPALTAGGLEVLRLRLSRERKSALGYALLAAAAGGRLRLPADDGSPERAELVRQLRLARAVYLPGRLLAFDVDEADGHDDHLFSLALTVEAAAGAAPLTAFGRRRE
ncbi:MAG TPA: hypothetical protein VKV26_06550 [Dehalococcoidia bacterium]|nr:hypothetical protein [Dehalococcoidia bacterium]